MKQRHVETFACPNCGEEVHIDALACPACGSDAETGWSDDTMYDNLDLPEPSWDIDKEPPDSRQFPTSGAIALVLIILILTFVLMGVW